MTPHYGLIWESASPKVIEKKDTQGIRNMSSLKSEDPDRQKTVTRDQSWTLQQRGSFTVNII